MASTAEPAQDASARVAVRRLALAAFALSGMAGLTYEVVWTRYLALFVGHGAYAQILVLATYLGGMALGALVAAGASPRLGRPLRWYAGVEVALGLLGLAFHPAFTLVTGFAYDTLFALLPGAPAVGAARWGLAGLMLLPQSVLLGSTFPLMAAASSAPTGRTRAGGSRRPTRSTPWAARSVSSWPGSGSSRRSGSRGPWRPPRA